MLSSLPSLPSLPSIYLSEQRDRLAPASGAESCWRSTLHMTDAPSGFSQRTIPGLQATAPAHQSLAESGQQELMERGFLFVLSSNRTVILGFLEQFPATSFLSERLFPANRFTYLRKHFPSSFQADRGTECHQASDEGGTSRGIRIVLGNLL